MCVVCECVHMRVERGRRERKRGREEGGETFVVKKSLEHSILNSMCWVSGERVGSLSG